MIDRYKGDKQMENIKSTKSKPKDPHSPNKEREKDSDRLRKQTPDYKPKPKDDGGSSMAKKKDPKKPMSPAAKRLKRTASRPK
jgi:hypothetical protein